MQRTRPVQSAPAQRPWSGLIVTVVVVGSLLWFAYSVADILFFLFIALLFSLYLGMISDFLQHRFRLPRPYGITAALLVSAIGVAGLGWLIVPPVLEQTQGLIATLPGLVAGWEASLVEMVGRNPLLQQILPAEAGEGRIASLLGHFGGGYFGGAVPYVFGAVTIVIHVFSVLVMGIFLALRPAMYREGLVTLVPPVHRDLARSVARDLAEVLRGWIGGQILGMLVLTALSWIGLMILGVPYALAFGVFTGLAAIVPFFGTLVSTLLPALFVVGAAGLGHAMLVVLLGLIIHLIESNLVHPLIMQRKVHLPPVLSILSVLMMAKLLGVVGLLVAVPVLASLMVILRRIYVGRILERTGFRRRMRPEGAAAPVPNGESVSPVVEGGEIDEVEVLQPVLQVGSTRT
jgi:predicted PurR-regulated permease PerM